ncbi:hypothetical protein ASD24_15270 [Paenibacillus sp. Root52]|uniref:DUF5643 domain-containing protein n=1 Tax=Paenibacillus amylolyticus TaxID=1451 RepID=A0AAP5LN75_PAEAM|nr:MULTISPECIES: DUF4179 domain-containing protein [Paenibacillus]KQY82734.1 hypothetical protein ASD24_15270 [Paenibacillus sp. Root52]MDR6723365.1 hypothetical protein [Paenibacillus amylolyticus]
MNTSPEEKVLIADAARLQRDVRQMNKSDTTHAIQRGLARARRTRRHDRSLTMKWISLLLVVFIGGAWLVSEFYERTPKQLTAEEQASYWEQLEPFRTLFQRDIDRSTMVSAINNGYVQMVDRTVVSDSYELTVNAVTADRTRLIVLYTGKTDATQDIYSVNQVKVVNAETNQSLGSMQGLNVPTNENTIYGRTYVMLDPNEPMPEKITMTYQISSNTPNVEQGSATVKSETARFSEQMNISFTLDSKFVAAKTDVIKPNYSFTLEGHSFLLSEIEMSPLSTKVLIQMENSENMDDEEKQSMMDLIRGVNIRSITKDGQITLLGSFSNYFSGDALVSLGSDRVSEDGIIYILGSNLLDDPQSLTFRLHSQPGKVYDSMNEVEKDMLEIKIK